MTTNLFHNLGVVKWSIHVWCENSNCFHLTTLTEECIRDEVTCYAIDKEVHPKIDLRESAFYDGLTNLSPFRRLHQLFECIVQVQYGVQSTNSGVPIRRQWKKHSQGYLFEVK